MKKVLWVVLAALLLVSCGKAVTAEPEKPLELTVDNLEGKWEEENNSTLWRKFTKEGKYITSDNTNGTFEIIDSKTIKCKWKNPAPFPDGEKNYTVIVYKNYIILDNVKSRRIIE